MSRADSSHLHAPDARSPLKREALLTTLSAQGFEDAGGKMKTKEKRFWKKVNKNGQGFKWGDTPGMSFWQNGDCPLHGIGGLTELAWADQRCGGPPSSTDLNDIHLALRSAGVRNPGFRRWAWNAADETDHDSSYWANKISEEIAGCLCILAGFK